MSITSTKGLTICLTKGNAVGVNLTPTNISKANTVVVTVASTTGLFTGQIVKMTGTGFTELDGKTFVVGTVTPTTFELLGANTTGSSGVLSGTPVAAYFPDAQKECLCLSAIDIAAGSTNTISVATFCDTSASVPGNPSPGTVTLSGYIDKDSTGYKELVAAELDGQPRHMIVTVPGNGYFMADIIIGSVSYTLPLEGSVGFSFSASFSSKLRHIFQ